VCDNAVNAPEKKQWAWAALLVLVTVLVYLPALKAGFIWDDDLLLTDNQRIQSPHGLRELWSFSLDSEFYPITWTSFWIEWRLWGMNPKGYHATNILFHVLGVLLVWRALVALGIPGAWWAALIFSIHPVNAESVAWISERKNTLSLIFYALTVLTFLHFDRTGKSGWYWASFASFAAALLSKTSGVGLPVVLLLCVWWRKDSIDRKDLLRVAPFFLLAIGFGLLTIWVQEWQSIGSRSFFLGNRPPLFRIGAAGHVFWFYVGKVLFPVNLMAVYPLWRFASVTPWFWAPTAAIILLLGVCWRFRARAGKAFLFAMLYCGAMLFPVLGVFDAPYIGRSPVVTDHLQYLATIGVISLVVAGIMRLPRAAANSLLVVILLVLAALSWRRASVFEDPVRFWNDTLARNPQASRAHYNLGVHFDKQRRYDEALKHYRLTIELDPNYGKGHNNLGKTLIRQGRLAEATEHFREAVRLLAGHGELYYNYGLALFLAKRFPESVIQLRQAIRHKPQHANAHACLASAHAQLGNTAKARHHLAEAARLDPRHPDFSRLLQPR